MNDEKDMPNEDWEVSVSNISPSEAEVENNGGGWSMPEPVFRVSEGDKVEKSNNKPLEAENTEDELPNYFSPQSESLVLEQPAISEEYKIPEIVEQTFQPVPISAKGEKGNAKWVVLLGGIFVFFAVLVGIILGVYYFFWNK